MINSQSYRIAFFAAIFLHLTIVAYFSYEKSNERPVLTLEAKNEAGQSQPHPVETPQAQPIQAVSVDSKEIMNAVNHLKEERSRQQEMEENRQIALKKQADLARKMRIEEQKQLEKLKSEAAALAVERAKQLAEEKEHLKQLAQQKAEEEKRLAEMKQQQAQLKKQQEQEAKKLAELTAKKAAEAAKANQEKAEKAKQELAQQEKDKAEKARAAWIKKQQDAAALAATEAANAAKVAGEVNKYKALILNAISQQWILPQNADSSMSSQFRIRLAPNGSVLEVALTRSSGDAILDRSAQSAIYKASPLPVPNDPTTFNLFRDISLTVRPVNGRG